MSRPYKFEIHTLVTGPFYGVGVVDSNRGSAEKGEQELCMVRIFSTKGHYVTGYPESALRRVSFWRFLFHRNPDGSYQVGNNSLWWFIIDCVFFAIIYIGLRGEFGVYAWVLRVLCIGTPIAWIFFTGRQYIGKSR